MPIVFGRPRSREVLDDPARTPDNPQSPNPQSAIRKAASISTSVAPSTPCCNLLYRAVFGHKVLFDLGYVSTTRAFSSASSIKALILGWKDGPERCPRGPRQRGSIPDTRSSAELRRRRACVATRCSWDPLEATKPWSMTGWSKGVARFLAPMAVCRDNSSVFSRIMSSSRLTKPVPTL